LNKNRKIIGFRNVLVPSLNTPLLKSFKRKKFLSIPIFSSQNT